MGIKCDDCGAEAKWTERECPNCDRPFADQRSGLVKKVHSKVHELSDILIETPSLFYKTTPHWRRAWQNYDPYEVSKAKSSSLKRTLYVCSIYTIITFFIFSEFLMISIPILFDAPEENAGPGEAEINNGSEAVEASEGDSNSDEGADSSEQTDSDESSTANVDNDVTSLDDLDSQLREGGIQVEYLDGGEDSIWLDYVTDANSDQEMRQEVETVAVTYAGLVDSGSSYGSNMMDVIFMDRYGNDLGGFFIMQDWAQEYADGDLSLEEYVERIITETLGYE